MVGARHAELGKIIAGERAQAALETVAHDCAADFLGDGEAYAHGRIAVIAAAELKDKTGHGDTLAAVGGEKICPFA